MQPLPGARHGATMSPRERFTDRAYAYRSARPGYPEDTVQFLFSSAGLGPVAELADVGSGTGKLTAQMLQEDTVQRLYAVEPNADMRQEAEAALGQDPRFVSVAGSGEETGLEDASVDAVTIAQAFHWFDFERSRAELQRVLRPDGRLAVLWNLRLEEGDGFHRDYESFLRTHGDGYLQVRATWAVRHELSPLFVARPVVHRSEVQQILDYDGLESRLMSSSYAPSAHAETEARNELRALFARHEVSGHVTMRYETVTYAGAVTRSA